MTEKRKKGNCAVGGRADGVGVNLRNLGYLVDFMGVIIRDRKTEKGELCSWGELSPLSRRTRISQRTARHGTWVVRTVGEGSAALGVIQLLCPDFLEGPRCPAIAQKVVA